MFNHRVPETKKVESFLKRNDQLLEAYRKLQPEVVLGGSIYVYRMK